ncbi:hypothetical protein GCM10010206_59410 [Streptomyces cinerochromogenes]|nr:hypothetical protein GCM10010206_59410 [Streptomyces cinerochromogenes]
MSSLNDSASFVSEEFAASGLTPAFARSSLTRFSTSASTAASRDTATGVEAGAGALVAVRDGVLSGRGDAEGFDGVVAEGFDGVVLGVTLGTGFLAGFFDGVRFGDAGFETEAEGEGDAEGDAEEGEGDADGLAEPARPAVPAVGVAAGLSTPPEAPPCSLAVLLGAPADCTRSTPAVCVLPPSRYWSRPGTTPVATATVPSATAADTPSRPARTGRPALPRR